jgi:hypothetical protein
LPFLWLHRGALNAPERWRSVAATPSLASLPGTRRHPRAGPICLPPGHAPTTTALPLILGSPEPIEREGGGDGAGPTPPRRRRGGRANVDPAPLLLLTMDLTSMAELSRLHGSELELGPPPEGGRCLWPPRLDALASSAAPAPAHVDHAVAVRGRGGPPATAPARAPARRPTVEGATDPPPPRAKKPPRPMLCTPLSRA